MTMVHDGEEHAYRGKAGRRAAKEAKRAARKARKIAAELRGAGAGDNPIVDSPSLMDALRERPGHGGSTLRNYPALTKPAFQQRTEARLPEPMWTEPGVTVKPMWTAQEYRTYERLTAIVCSPIISERATAEVWLRRFVEKHGKDKCDMMMAEIRRRDAAEWFKENQKGPRR